MASLASHAAASAAEARSAAQPRIVKIATRPSKLALTQAQQVAHLLERASASTGTAVVVQLVPMTTRGDVPAAAPSGQALPTMRELGPGAFTEELDQAVLRGDADLAVHSLKDHPPATHPGLVLAACLPREDPRDVLLSALPGVTCIADLPPGAVLGTSSSRRKAQVLALNPRVQVVPMRGNVDSRVEQMCQGHVQATLLAAAGLKRLGQLPRDSSPTPTPPPPSPTADPPTQVTFTPVPLDQMLPAACQGIVGVVARASSPAQPVPDSGTQSFTPRGCPSAAAGAAGGEADGALLGLLRSAGDADALLQATAERAALLQLMAPVTAAPTREREVVRRGEASLQLPLAMPRHPVAVLCTVQRPRRGPASLRVRALVVDGARACMHHVEDATELEGEGGGGGLRRAEELGRRVGRRLKEISDSIGAV